VDVISAVVAITELASRAVAAMPSDGECWRVAANRLP
jgi:hypothetical protein